MSPPLTTLQGTGCYTTGVKAQEKAENCYGEASSIMYPPVTIECPAPINPTPNELSNRFLNQLYLKYPFLIPSGVRKEQPAQILQRRWSQQYDKVTTYQEDYCELGRPEPPCLVRAAGLLQPEPPKPTNRLPGYPYLMGLRNPLSSYFVINKGDNARKKKEVTHEGQKKIDKPLPRISEYEDNFNLPPKLWKKIGVYTENKVEMRRKHTLPD